MDTRIIIFAYNPASQSLRLLRRELQQQKIPFLLLSQQNSKKLSRRWVNIGLNWGKPKFYIGTIPILNRVEVVSRAVNKLLTFQTLVDTISIPEFTTDINVAKEWLKKSTVVVRNTLTGHSGEGIVIVEPGEQLSEAPLYVKYIPKKAEFRVHVFNGKVIDVQQKRRVQGFSGERQSRIRNTSTGWVYCRQDIREPDSLREIALGAVTRLGLDFGAVDIIWNEKLNKCFVLEVNTAPGLEGTTVKSYANAIKEYLNVF